MVLGTAVAGLTCLADVTSANIVGYTADTLRAGKFSLISLPFAGVANPTQKLIEAMTVKNVNGAEHYADGDQLQVWGHDEKGNGMYFNYYYYAEDPANPGVGEYDGWYDKGESYYFDDCVENLGGLEAGWCAWYLSQGAVAPQITMSGAVESSDDAEVWIYGGGYSLVANPFPVRLKLNDSTQVNWGKITGAEHFADGDQIQVWGFDDKGNGKYDNYYYYAEDPAAPGAGEYDGWYDKGESYYFEDMPDTDNANGLQVGQPFWYYSQEAKGENHKIYFWNPTK